MTPTVAVIPTRYDRERLGRLLGVITDDVDLYFMFDNGHEPPLPEMASVIPAVGDGIYRMWNRGWEMARDFADGPVNVAILNDDIRILPGTLAMLAQALRADDRLGCVYPDRHTPLHAGLPPKVHTTALFDPVSSREMTGFCFMFKGELALPPFDEGMEWWYSDSIFDEEVKLAGYGVAQVDGLPIEHKSDAETDGWARRPELREAVERDGIRWAALHDRIEGGRWVPK